MDPSIEWIGEAAEGRQAAGQDKPAEFRVVAIVAPPIPDSVFGSAANCRLHWRGAARGAARGAERGGALVAALGSLSSFLFALLPSFSTLLSCLLFGLLVALLLLFRFFLRLGARNRED